ncbi:MAG: MMPL family transporter [Myxococcota bacterium]|nr:MMPL family transporter [Myxococcota bacterium]
MSVLADPASFAAACGLLFLIGFAVAALRPAWIAGHPKSVLLGLGAITGIALQVLLAGPPVGLNLRIDPSTEPLLPAGDPSQEVYARAVANFGEDEVYVIAMETDDGVFTVPALEVLREVSDRIVHFPEVRQVQSLTDVVAFRYDAEGDWIEVADFMEEIPRDPEALAALEAEALGEVLYQKTLISDDGRTAAVNVTFRKMSDAEFIDSQVDERVMAVLAELERPGIRFFVAGRSHAKVNVYHLMIRDMQVMIPLALGVVALGLLVVFGTRRGVVIPMAVILIATVWTFAAIAWLDQPLTVLTTLMAPMLAAIGSVYGIHGIARYEEEAAQASTPREAAQRALEHMRLPVLVAGLTTMIGFGALMITDVPAVFDIGGFAVLGVGSITLLSLTLLPAALALAPLRPAGSGFGISGWVARTIDAGLSRVATAVAARPSVYIGIWVVAFGICAAAIPRIVIDTDYLSMLPTDSPVRVEFEAVNRLLSGAVPIYISFEGEERGAFRHPEALHVLRELEERADGIETVGHTASVVDTVRVMNRRMAKDDPAEERIPDTRGAVAELLFMAPKGHLDRYTNVNHSNANVMVRTGAVGTAAVRKVVAELEALLEEVGPAPGATAHVTGNAILLAHSADGITRSQPRTIGLAAVAIFVLISFAFRSLRLGAVAMVPNVVPVVVYFGVLGLGAAPLSLATSLIGSVALGIAIDDTAHFLVRYGSERRTGNSPLEAARITGMRVGRPIAITSFMLMLGFLVVSLSSFETLRQFGLLSAMTMGVCLLTDLVLLPALLIRARA